MPYIQFYLGSETPKWVLDQLSESLLTKTYIDFDHEGIKGRLKVDRLVDTKSGDKKLYFVGAWLNNE